MNDKYAKEIARELRLIRQELQKINQPSQIEFHGETVTEEITWDDVKERAGDKVTIK